MFVVVARRNQKLRYDLSFLGLLVFIVVNVWLSLLIKKLKNEAAEMELFIRREKSDVFRLNSHIQSFREVFCMNMGFHKARLTVPPEDEFRNAGNAESVMQLLYLKAHACSECNIYIIDWLVRRNAGLDNFLIVAHSSNAFYLQEMYHDGVITDPSSIIWYDDDLYRDHLSESTADLIFVDKDNVIQVLFPLDFIKDVCLFDDYLQCIDAAMNRLHKRSLSCTETKRQDFFYTTLVDHINKKGGDADAEMNQ